MSAGGSQWERVPDELKRQPRWVCWKLVERDGRKTKMPVCAATGKMASSTDASTWCSFGAAVAAVGRLGASGIGFVFGPDRAYTGLDLDHVMHDGFLLKEYRWVVEESGTYCEVSPSGDGLHLFFRGGKPEGATRCRRGGVEMYDHDRFFTVTGNAWGVPRPIQERPDIVERAYRTWIEPEAVAAGGQLPIGAAPAVGVAGTDAVAGSSAGGAGGAADAAAVGAGDGGSVADLTDDELVERMLRSSKGAEIKALMGGDMSAQGNDHSAADMALCNHLAFWCAGDEARMDRIFRASGLMREKWDSGRGGSTYGAQTLARAVQGAREFYTPRPRREGRRDASRRVESRRGTVTRAGANAAAPNTYICSMDAPRVSDKGVSDSGGEMDATAENAPSIERWQVDGRGQLWARGADGEFSRSVTSTAPWVACDLVDVDTGDVRALVRVRVGGKVVERAIARDVLMNQAKVISALGPLGANISSANAKDVVCYLTDCERRLGFDRPRRRSVRHLGWAKEPLGAFMPYDAGAGGEDGVRFDASPDELLKARPFMEPKGTLEEWVAGIAPARSASMAFRCVMAASFASPLVSLLDVQTFIVYLWGRSRSGKTPTLKAAGSVWGDPSEGSDSYFRTFADTPKSIVRAAALLHDVPVIVDELQSKGSPGGQAGKRMIVEDLLYSLSLGHERGALNSDRSMMRAGSWRCLTLATGEIPIVGDSTQQGAANRTLELNAEPFGDVRAAQAMHRHVAACHGTAGRAFVAALRRGTREAYRKQFAYVRDAVAAMANGHPQADNVALIALADALAERFVFSPGREWKECVAGALELAAWALGASTGLDAGDTDLKAMQFVSEWLVRNKIHFDDACEMDRLERFGVTETQTVVAGEPATVWCVFNHVLTAALNAANFDRQKTLRRMADEGVLELKGADKGLTRQRRFGGDRIYCVCIKQKALEAVLERPTDAAAVLTPCPEEPC